ncbi:hypothetical protein Barb7_02170 [Bacteroidales bacterium Barb7]|nr:hypothetical protein Barb7_02170 [Bacteroidales bacterium Barb7]
MLVYGESEPERDFAVVVDQFGYVKHGVIQSAPCGVSFKSSGVEGQPFLDADPFFPVCRAVFYFRFIQIIFGSGNAPEGEGGFDAFVIIRFGGLGYGKSSCGCFGKIELHFRIGQ